jgi:hypothetical protein
MADDEVLDDSEDDSETWEGIGDEWAASPEPPLSTKAAQLGIAYGYGGKKKREPVSQWGVRGTGIYYPCGVTIPKIPAGTYSVGRNDHGYFLEATKFPTDELLRFPDGPTPQVVDRVERFWARGEAFKKNGLLHKMGILLYGPAGCGKTSVIKLVTEDIMERGGVILLTDVAGWMAEVFRMVRGVEPSRSIVNIIEDIDDKMREPEHAGAILSMLDGEHQVDNILHIATTNYPERLEERITQRPGRFDFIVKMDLPSALARRAYFERFACFVDSEDKTGLEKWVKDTEGLGVAHLREMVAAVECLGLDYDQTLARLKENKERPPKRGGEKKLGYETMERKKW